MDDKALLLPDRPGNNQVDSLRNIVENPGVGLLFFVPGMNETLRVKGNAEIVTEDEHLGLDYRQGSSTDFRPPRHRRGGVPPLRPGPDPLTDLGSRGSGRSFGLIQPMVRCWRIRSPARMPKKIDDSEDEANRERLY